MDKLNHNSYQRLSAGVILLGLSLLLSGCGFKLRGTGFESLAGQKVQLVTAQPWGGLERELRAALKRYEIIAQDSSGILASEQGILIERVENRREVISVDADGRPAEYDNIMIAYVQFKKANQQPFKEQIRISRDYRFDKNNSLAHDRELRVQTEQMHKSLARRISQQFLKLLVTE